MINIHKITISIIINNYNTLVALIFNSYLNFNKIDGFICELH